MPIVTDIRSNANDQIAHAATVIGFSKHRKRVFLAIYRGKENVKTVSEVVRLSGLHRISVLQQAGLLADNGIVHKIKMGGVLAYEREPFYSQNKERVLRLSGNREALDRLPTKFDPIHDLSVTIAVPKSLVKVMQVSIDDIDSFNKVRKVKLQMKSDTPIQEKQLKEGLKKIVDERGISQDWGGESNDLFSTRIVFKGKRVSTAFALKGKGTTGILVPKKMGKRGDQLQRLFASPADLFLVQYWSQIDDSILDQMRKLAIAKSWSESRTIYFGIIDGQDTQRVIKAYAKFFAIS